MMWGWRVSDLLNARLLALGPAAQEDLIKGLPQTAQLINAEFPGR